MIQSLDLNDLCVDKPERSGWSTAFGRVFAEAASVVKFGLPYLYLVRKG